MLSSIEKSRYQCIHKSNLISNVILSYENKVSVQYVFDFFTTILSAHCFNYKYKYYYWDLLYLHNGYF